jgi:hypothetical protein
MKKRCVSLAIASVALAICVSGTMAASLFAQLKSKPAVRATLPDRPVIREFSANPATLAGGKTTVLRWRVDPGPGGSQISSVQIDRTDGSGPNLSVRTSDPAGERTLSVPAGAREGRSTYALTAVNGAGLSTVKTVSIEITGPPDLVVKEIVSTGLSVGFTVTNIGRALFRGNISLRVSVLGSPAAIGPDRFQEISRRADGLYEATAMQISPGGTFRFRLLDPESGADGWYSGSYPISVQISTDDPTEDPGNNEKRVTLDHAGVRRGAPALDLYVLGQIRLLTGGSSLWKNVKFTVFNTGPPDAADIEWEVRIADTEQVRRGEPGMRIKSGKIGRLAPGQTEISWDQDFAIAVDKPMLLRVIIDPEDKIFEKDETNNKQDLAFTLHRR